MALFRVNDMNAKKSVVVANAGPTVVVVLGNAIDVDVNKHDDDGTSRPEDFCCVTSMMMKILLVLFVFFSSRIF